MRAPTWHRAMSLGLLDEKIWKWAAPLWRGAPVGWKHAVGLEYRRAKAPEVALSYHTAFAGMSQAFGVTVVGPSLALPVVGESEEGWKIDKRAPFKRVAGVFSLGKLVKTASQASLALDDEAWQIIPGEGSATWTASVRRPGRPPRATNSTPTLSPWATTPFPSTPPWCAWPAPASRLPCPSAPRCAWNGAAIYGIGPAAAACVPRMPRANGTAKSRPKVWPLPLAPKLRRRTTQAP